MTGYIVLAVLWVIGVFTITLIIRAKKPKGYLYVFDNDELYLQLNIPIEDVRKYRLITFQVDEMHNKEKTRE